MLANNVDLFIYLLDLSLFLPERIPELPALCVRGEQLEAGGVIQAFSLMQLLLLFLHARVGHPEALQ